MSTILATLVVFGLAVSLLALGTVLAGRGLSASCGGGREGGACAACQRPCKRRREGGT